MHSAVVIAVFALALWDLARRPRDVGRLLGRAGRFMAPAWALLVVATAISALLAPWGEGYGTLLLEWVFPDAVGLVMAQVFLAAGAVWVWRGGLRGRGFGWMRRPGRWRDLVPLGPLVVGIAATVGLTFAVFSLIGVEPDPEFEAKMASLAEQFGVSLGLLALLRLFTAAFIEETLYRHYLQTRLAFWFERHGIHWFAACVIASLLWSLGHAGLLASDWAKFAQIFPVGLLLGYYQRRWGVTLAIAVHLGLNVSVIFLSNLVVGP
jgi:membrane protease YdiL (CAAX protease family)